MTARLSRPLVVAIVSGKGGVGKTSLAANFSWICARVAPTVLVDLDFPNQGATGLMAPRAPLEGVDALRALNTGVVRSSELMEIAPGLRFVPAVSWNSSEPDEQQVTDLAAKDFDRHLDGFLKNLTAHCEQDIVVLDCHGGVDAVSAAAFKCSDLTLMVTEADSVTFAGTLELLAHYRRALASGAPLRELRTERRSPDPQVRFIVNRLAGKYRYDDLDRMVYGAQLRELGEPDQFGRFSRNSSVLCYIPNDEMVAESFGEYPFQAQIAPDSVFALKVTFVVWTVLSELGEHPDHTYRPLSKMNNERHRNKIRRTVISAEERNTRQIVGGFAWSSTLAVVFGGLAVLWVTLAQLLGVDLSTSLEKNMPLRSVAIALGGGLGLVVLGYYASVFLSLFRYYKARHRFQRELFRLLGQRLSAWQRVALFKLLLLRIGTTITTVTFFLYIVAATIGLALVGMNG